jgi:hypothetical protein
MTKAILAMAAFISGANVGKLLPETRMSPESMVIAAVAFAIISGMLLCLPKE